MHLASMHISIARVREFRSDIGAHFADFEIEAIVDDCKR